LRPTACAPSLPQPVHMQSIRGDRTNMRKIAIYGKGGSANPPQRRIPSRPWPKWARSNGSRLRPEGRLTRLLLGGLARRRFSIRCAKKARTSPWTISAAAATATHTARVRRPRTRSGMRRARNYHFHQPARTVGRLRRIREPRHVFYDVLGDVVCGGFAMPFARARQRRSTSSVPEK